MAAAAHRLPFTSRQLFILTATGAFLWFVASQICRIGGPLGWFDGSARILLYAAVIVGTWPIIPVVKRLAGLAGEHVALGIAILTATALLLDGIALAWFPALYGGGDAQAARSGAVILWGAGVGIVIACWFNRVPQQ